MNFDSGATDMVNVVRTHEQGSFRFKPVNFNLTTKLRIMSFSQLILFAIPK